MLDAFSSAYSLVFTFSCSLNSTDSITNLEFSSLSTSISDSNVDAEVTLSVCAGTSYDEQPISKNGIINNAINLPIKKPL